MPAQKKCRIAMEADTVCCVTHGYHYRAYNVTLAADELADILLDRYNDHRAKRIENHE